MRMTETLAGTWSFFESDRGKRAADDIGATLKRCTDQAVAHGTDIPDAETLLYVLRDQSLEIKLFFVLEEKSESDDTSMSSIDFSNNPEPNGCDAKYKLQVRPGAYVLVNVFEDNRSKNHYRFVCQEEFVTIMMLKMGS
ncbi:hypothetical protein AVEN_188300-1 [Araneus ventricosus]|uniref:Uncharacterized protein n=1 Tax=Araneus ventricosus TaxID=182803 RepID=A0A4Y2JI15_ARAVE|nr:hypothetical protein AVEN_188300-1 [Araneus ventricosus]